MQGLLEALRPGQEDESLARTIDLDRLPAHIGHRRDRRFGGLGAPATRRDGDRLSEALGIPAR